MLFESTYMHRKKKSVAPISGLFDFYAYLITFSTLWIKFKYNVLG